MQYKITAALIMYQMVFLCTSGYDIRASCPDPSKNGTQCSKDCKTFGYCYMNTWTVLDICEDNSACIPEYPDVGCMENVECTNTWTDDVKCIESGIKVPNLEDSTCSTYYECKESSQPSRLVSPDEPQYCSNGDSFDPCTQNCTSKTECHDEFTCEKESYFTQLSSNNKFAYACINLGNGRPSLVWKYCKIGIYDPTSFECKGEETTECITDSNSGECEEAGRIPLPGTTCTFRLCFGNLTYADIDCSVGYMYDDNQKKCVPGDCM